MKEFLRRLSRHPEQFIEFLLDNDLTLRQKTDTVKDYLSYPIIRIYDRAKHVLHWLPIILKDEDWDSEYLMVMIRQKFMDMAEYATVHGHCKNSDQQAKEMRYLAHLLKRIIEDDYCKASMDKFYTDNPLQWLEGENDRGWVTMKLVISDKERKRFTKILEVKDQLQKHDLLKFSELFRRRILHFWD